MGSIRFFKVGVLLIGVVIAAGAAAACGGKSSPGSSTGSATATAVSSVTIPDGAAVIDQQDLTFKPGTVTVKTGGQIYFKNSEATFHTVTIQGKNISGIMKKGSIVVWTAPAPGTYKVGCDYHPQMHATITVTP
jgi:plastocyanin